MEWLVVLALLAILLLLFGDILMMLVIRIGMFILLLWMVCMIQRSVASVVMQTELFSSPVAANLVGFVAVMFLCCSLLYWSSHAASSAVNAAQMVGVDAFRVGLLVAIGTGLLITLGAVASDQLLLISWIWLTILAVFAAGFDVCFPSVLGGTVNMLTPEISSNTNKRGFNHVS